MDSMTVAEVAEKLNVSSRTVNRWCRKGLLRSVKAGKAYIIPSAALGEFTPPKRGRPGK